MWISLFEEPVLKIRVFLFVCLCLILVLINAVAQESINSSPNEETKISGIETLFPAKPGFRWRYLRETGEGTSHYATDFLGSLTKNEKKYQILGNPYGTSYYEITPDMLVLRGIAPADDIKKVDFYEDGGLIRIKKPVKKGNKWEGKATLKRENEIIITSYRSEILGWSKVNVPVGSFDSLVTSSTLNTVFIKTEDGFGKGAVTMEQIWYAPRVGIVRRTIYLMYPGRPLVMLRDDKLEEFIRERRENTGE